MTKSEAGPEDNKPAAVPAAQTGPPPELVELFRQLEARVEEAARQIGELRRDKRELEARLDEATKARAEAVQRIDALIDKIDGLL